MDIRALFKLSYGLYIAGVECEGEKSSLRDQYRGTGNGGAKPRHCNNE